MFKHLDHLHRLHRKLRLRYGEHDPCVQDLEYEIRQQRERDLAAHDEHRQERRARLGQVADRCGRDPVRQVSGLADMATFLLAARRNPAPGNGAGQTR